MTTSQGACQALHYGCAVSTFVYLAISILINAGQVKQRKIIKRHSRSFTPLIGLLAFTYAAHIFYTVALTLIWSVLGGRHTRKSTGQYEALGISSLAFAFDVPLLALSTFRGLSHFAPTAQLANKISRILLLGLVVIYTWWKFLKQRNSPGDEARPILQDHTNFQSNGHISYGTEPLLSHTDNEIDDSNIDKDSDINSDDDPEIKAARDRRLQETGSWWNYLKDFSIFLPYLIPQKDRKVQACIAVSLLCLVCTRFFNILIPRQLGLVTDRLLTKESPYGELATWLLLSFLAGESGFGLIQELTKIPIKQFSCRQISNTAFSHVMNLGMDFHSERDSAEVMKAIEQGGALTNVLETAVLEIAPVIVDLFVAAFFLYWKFSAYVSLAMVIASISYVTVEVFTTNLNVPNRRRWTKSTRDQTRVMHQAVQG